jgi:hypothetical protein
VLNDRDRRAVASATRQALAWLDVASVRLGHEIDAGSRRSVTLRARAERRAEDPVDVVVKLTLGSRDGFVRERAALGLVAEHGLPGAVRMLGWWGDPPLVVLQDLGHGPSVADLLLGDDPDQAERALLDWAATVGSLQAATSRLGDEFRARLLDPAGIPAARSDRSRRSAPSDVLSRWVTEAADILEELLRPLRIRPAAAALDELGGLLARLDPHSAGAGGLVAGDTCPDNALYVDGRLSLIDFEAAAHRHVAWEAAYLLVPWPTCWCSWALPAAAVANALTVWREAVAPAIPAVAEDSFADDLACATIAWTFVSLTFLLSPAITEADGATPTTAFGRSRPDPRSLVLHRLRVAADYPTATLPALRDLAEQAHDACSHLWGNHALDLAPAFRGAAAATQTT